MSGLKLVDCTDFEYPGGTELLVVEGDSAARSVVAQRDQRWQAVVPVQGKPMNTLGATRAKVATSAPLQRIVDALGCGWGQDCDPTRARYDRLVLLFDPDVDGVHARSLVLIFLHTWMRPILDAGMVFAARPPLWAVVTEGSEDSPMYAYTDAQIAEVDAKIAEQNAVVIEKVRFRGLGNMSPEILYDTCLNERERILVRVQPRHAEVAIASLQAAQTMLRTPPKGA